MRIRQGAGGCLEGIVDEPGEPDTAAGALRGRVSSTGIAWIVAAALSLSLAGFLAYPSGSQSNQSPKVATDGSASPAPEEPVAAEPADAGLDSSPQEQQLVELHGRIASFLNQNGCFPTGTVHSDQTPVSERFSWLATVAAVADPDGPQPRWDRRWNDPANDRFVRRQQPMFLNPALESVVGGNHYPATHFVGVAGVSADAATLPRDHPRAGIFGHDREVGIGDVQDGLANTMLVVGVESDLGSWAAGGESTVRGFTAEPYLRGPDGFGTGQEDGMHVLMADGSVRFLAKETSPAIVRRMAAMNDGLPLDPAVPGEPGVPSETEEPVLADNDNEANHSPDKMPEDESARADARPPVVNAPTIEAAQVIADLAQPRDHPIDVPLAEPPIVYDVEAALRQRILRFEQSDPVPVRDLLRLVEEMAAVPIRFDELPAELVPRLDRPLTLSLAETSVGEILQALLAKAGLAFEGRPEGIVIQAPDEEAAPSLGAGAVP